VSDFAAPWELSRSRFIAEFSGLRQDQLDWSPASGVLSIGQMAAHVAGVEAYFSRQLRDLTLEPGLRRVEMSAVDGVVNDKAFPFEAGELTVDGLLGVFAETEALVRPMMDDPASIANKSLVSALGPVIDGRGALTRLAFHPAYHQGQAYLLKQLPGYPS